MNDDNFCTERQKCKIPENNKGINAQKLVKSVVILIAKFCKWRIGSSTDEWIKKTWHLHTMEYYATIRKTNLSGL